MLINVRRFVKHRSCDKHMETGPNIASDRVGHYSWQVDYLPKNFQGVVVHGGSVVHAINSGNNKKR